MKRSSFLLSVLLSFILAAPARAKTKPAGTSKTDAAKVDRLEKEVDALRSEILEMKATQEEFFVDASERTGTARAFFSDKLTFGGFFETGLTSLWGPGTAHPRRPGR